MATMHVSASSWLLCVRASAFTSFASAFTSTRASSAHASTVVGAKRTGMETVSDRSFSDFSDSSIQKRRRARASPHMAAKLQHATTPDTVNAAMRNDCVS